MRTIFLIENFWREKPNEWDGGEGGAGNGVWNILVASAATPIEYVNDSGEEYWVPRRARLVPRPAHSCVTT